MTKVITHNGTAHRDDLLSTSLVIAQDSNVETIERRNPTPSEIQDVNTWILDVGGTFNPDIKAFDHHQNDWNECTLSLLLKTWGLWDSAVKALPWLEASVVLDTGGITALRKKYDVDYNVICELQSPVEEEILQIFSRKSVIKINDILFIFMRRIGYSILQRISDYKRLIHLLGKRSIIKKKKGIPIIVYLESEPSKTLSLVIQHFKNKVFGNTKGGLSILKDNRNINAIRIFRFNNDKRIDLTRLNKEFNVLFLHKKEFLSVIHLPENENLENVVDNILECVII